MTNANEYSILIKTIVVNSIEKISQLKFNNKIDNISNAIVLITCIIYRCIDDGIGFNLNHYVISCIATSLLYQMLNFPTENPNEVIIDVEKYYAEIVNNAKNNKDSIIESIKNTYNYALENPGPPPNDNGFQSVLLAESYSCAHNSQYIIVANSILDLVKNSTSMDNNLIVSCVNKAFLMGCDVYATSGIVGSAISLCYNKFAKKFSIKESEFLAVISGCAGSIKEIEYNKSIFVVVRKFNKNIDNNGKRIGGLFIVLTVCKIFDLF